METRNAPVVAAMAAVVLLSAATNAAEANGIKLKVTGVAVVDDNHDARKGVEFLPPETRVVVPSSTQFAMFRIEYDVPTNMNARIFLEHNGDTAKLACDFRFGASSLYHGAGTVYRPLGLDGDVYDSGVLLKSVRLSAEVEGDDGDGSDSLYVCDAPVNVLFAKDGEKKTDGFKVLEPLPPPPAKSLSLLPGCLALCGSPAEIRNQVLERKFIASEDPFRTKQDHDNQHESIYQHRIFKDPLYRRRQQVDPRTVFNLVVDKEHDSRCDCRTCQ